MADDVLATLLGAGTGAPDRGGAGPAAAVEGTRAVGGDHAS